MEGSHTLPLLAEFIFRAMRRRQREGCIMIMGITLLAATVVILECAARGLIAPHEFDEDLPAWPIGSPMNIVPAL